MHRVSDSRSRGHGFGSRPLHVHVSIIITSIIKVLPSISRSFPPADRRVIRLSELLELQQVITRPTHGDVKPGNTLDVSSCAPTSCRQAAPLTRRSPSTTQLWFASSRPCRSLPRGWSTLVRRVNSIINTQYTCLSNNREAFSRSLASFVLCAKSDELRQMRGTELFDVHDVTLRQTADIDAPASTSARRIRRLSLWFDHDCRQARCLSRLLKRR